MLENFTPTFLDRINLSKNTEENINNSYDEYKDPLAKRFGHSEQAFLISLINGTIFTFNPNFGEKDNFFTLSHMIDFIAIAECVTPYDIEIESIGFLITSKLDVCKICGDTLFTACQKDSYFYKLVDEMIHKKTNIKNNEVKKIDLFVQVSSLKTSGDYYNSRKNMQEQEFTIQSIEIEKITPFIAQKYF